MDLVSKIKDSILPLLEEHGVQLYEILWRNEGKTKILQIAIMHKDGTMDIDGCAEMAEVIGNKLDELDSITYEYMLEVCSPGAERVLRSLDEVKDVVGEYVFIKLINEVDKLSEVTGTFMEINDDELLIQYMNKAVKKKMKVKYSNISLIRLSVKF